jgi:hypothetical protein
MSQPKVSFAQQNIMEITNLVDLKYIMSSCVTVIAGFTTPYTPQKLKVYIRKFLKRKSENYPLITFVYMEVSDADRKTLNILKGGIDDYPRIYHIRGGNNIMVEVNAANEETISASFKQVEKLYVDEMKAFQQHIKNKNISDTDEKIDSNDDQIISDDPDEESEHVQILKKSQKNTKTNKKLQTSNNEQYNINQQDNNLITQNETQNDQTPEQQIDPVLEKKKNLEKLVLLNKKCDELKLNMVKEIAKRKKMEVIIDKKNDDEKKNDDGKEYRKSLRKTLK